MKIVKRDGKIVDYNSEKIKTAINKANAEVPIEARATDEEIERIVVYIESLKKKRMLVEDIQDIIEEKLMEFGKFVLAKEYIVYRYTRALVRKSNTTDSTILSIIKNDDIDISNSTNNKRVYQAHAQRNLIAGEVSKDLTTRVLLPEKIANAHINGAIYFHDSDYFIQPVINSCVINISDMLDNGTVINGIKLNSPEDFISACLMLVDIILAVSSNQCGGVSIEISHLGKYLRCHEEQLEFGIKTILIGINTLITASGIKPNVTVIIDINENEKYIQENISISESILKQILENIPNGEKSDTYLQNPKFAYVLNENNSLKGGTYDYITRLALECSIKCRNVKYVSAKKLAENNLFGPIGENDFLSAKLSDIKNKYVARFNQGKVSINLAQLGIISKGDEDYFWHMLDENIQIAFEALMARHYALLGTMSDVSPIHWEAGGLTRLNHNTKIDALLKSRLLYLNFKFRRYQRGNICIKRGSSKWRRKNTDS